MNGSDGAGFRASDPARQPRYTGIATLLRAEYRTDPSGLDIALVGVPTEFTVFRNGTRWGPCQVREMSRNMRAVNAATLRDPFADAAVADVGDAPVNPFSLEATNESLEQYFAALAASRLRTLAVGGDHGITLPILRALARVYGPLGVLQVDAHHDTHDQLYGTRDNHATLMRRAVEERLVDPTRVVQLGLRGSLYASSELDWSKRQGFTQISADEIATLGVAHVAEQVAAVLGDGRSYLTLDIDGLDPAVAPGTGVLEPGGIDYRDCVALLRAAAGADFVGADITEIAPPLDPSGRTALVGAHLLFEQLCLVAGAHARAAAATGAEATR